LYTNLTFSSNSGPHLWAPGGWIPLGGYLSSSPGTVPSWKIPGSVQSNPIHVQEHVQLETWLGTPKYLLLLMTSIIMTTSSEHVTWCSVLFSDWLLPVPCRRRLGHGVSPPSHQTELLLPLHLRYTSLTSYTWTSC